MKLPDIDIDVADRQKVLAVLEHRLAFVNDKGQYRSHPSGIYVQDMPYERLNNIGVYDYEEAEALGFVKLDILNNTSYETIESNDEIDELMSHEPLWDLFESEEVLRSLPQLSSDWAVSIALKMPPKSIEELAKLLAVIRPGGKEHIGKAFSAIPDSIWQENEKYTFKRAHAISYAYMIVVVMNKKYGHAIV